MLKVACPKPHRRKGEKICKKEIKSMKESRMIKTEEYLTVKELSERIKYEIQSIYNLIHRGEFILGIHYLKPSHRKILFKWSVILKWLGDKSHDQTNEHTVYDYSKKANKNYSKKKRPSKKGLINI